MTRHLLLIVFRLFGLWLIFSSLWHLAIMGWWVVDWIRTGSFELLLSLLPYIGLMVLMVVWILILAPWLATAMTANEPEPEPSTVWTPERVERLIVVVMGLLLVVKSSDYFFQWMRLIETTISFNDALGSQMETPMPDLKWPIAMMIVYFTCGFAIVTRSRAVAAWIRRRVTA